MDDGERRDQWPTHADDAGAWCRWPGYSRTAFENRCPAECSESERND